MPDIASFCFPEGVFVREHPAPSEVFHQVFTESNGVKLFCTCLRTYEELNYFELASRIRARRLALPPWLTERSPPTYAPKALAIVSQLPVFALSRRILCKLLRLSLGSFFPIERHLRNLLCEVPLPPRGVCSVGFTIGDEHFVLARPPPTALPLFDIPMFPLFHCLDVDNLLTVRMLCVPQSRAPVVPTSREHVTSPDCWRLVQAFTALLCERSVTLCSRHLSMLTPCAEALRSLLFPFNWESVYVPVLGSEHGGIIDGPIPTFFGFHGACW
jgi:hypothetical protein